MERNHAYGRVKRRQVVQAFVDMLDMLDDMMERIVESDGFFIGLEGPLIQQSLDELCEAEVSIDLARDKLWRVVQRVGLKSQVGAIRAEQHNAWVYGMLKKWS